MNYYDEFRLFAFARKLGFYLLFYANQTERWWRRWRRRRRRLPFGGLQSRKIVIWLPLKSDRKLDVRNGSGARTQNTFGKLQTHTPFVHLLYCSYCPCTFSFVFSFFFCFSYFFSVQNLNKITLQTTSLLKNERMSSGQACASERARDWIELNWNVVAIYVEWNVFKFKWMVATQLIWYVCVCVHELRLWCVTMNMYCWNVMCRGRGRVCTTIRIVRTIPAVE